MIPEAKMGWHCPSCDAAGIEETSWPKMYECGTCGEVFESEDGGNRCPECNRFASKIADHVCTDCHEPVEFVSIMLCEECDTWVLESLWEVHSKSH